VPWPGQARRRTAARPSAPPARPAARTLCPCTSWSAPPRLKSKPVC
jgi:hypothetical protein